MGVAHARKYVVLPGGWPKTVRSALLHAISLAFNVMTVAYGRAARSRNTRHRIQADLDLAWTEIALLREELSIKDLRWNRVPPRRRPYYGPIQRMGILKLKAARGWSASQTARIFLVTEATIASWLERIDEEGERALVQIAESVNRFPEFVGYLVRWLKTMCPLMGKVRIAQVLARSGLQLGATTVGRMLKVDGPIEEPSEVALAEEVDLELTTRVVRARYPDHTWNVDLTVIPTSAGFWVPWLPFSKPQSWPFCWWLAVVVDHFSRRLQGFAVFTKEPAAADVCAFLDRVVDRAGARPKHMITDQGSQFTSDEYLEWCDDYGASADDRVPLMMMLTRRSKEALFVAAIRAVETGKELGWFSKIMPAMVLGPEKEFISLKFWPLDGKGDTIGVHFKPTGAAIEINGKLNTSRLILYAGKEDYKKVLEVK